MSHYVQAGCYSVVCTGCIGSVLQDLSMAGINIEGILGLGQQSCSPQYTLYPLTDITQLAAGCDLIQVGPYSTYMYHVVSFDMAREEKPTWNVWISSSVCMICWQRFILKFGCFLVYIIILFFLPLCRPPLAWGSRMK